MGAKLLLKEAINHLDLRAVLWLEVLDSAAPCCVLITAEWAKLSEADPFHAAAVLGSYLWAVAARKVCQDGNFRNLPCVQFGRQHGVIWAHHGDMFGWPLFPAMLLLPPLLLYQHHHLACT